MDNDSIKSYEIQNETKSNPAGTKSLINTKLKHVTIIEFTNKYETK
jgi:hypothetical protein